MLVSSTPEILEVTLRDGSYAIDFQFTSEDTAAVASGLEAAGFRWIEVGHGLGLNASTKGLGNAAATDEEYLEAAGESLKTARWGMFFIPGIGRLEDLRLAAKYKMAFVRIGTNVTEAGEARPYIELAKELGMIVSYNAMKSYAVAPSEFARQAARVYEWGADIACLVDSAGGMYPDDVASYLSAARSESDVPLGFHGHDNLSLAMANTLTAIENGAVIVDSSLQGMGRSAGNAVTEILAAILKKRGLLSDIDLKVTMDVGQSLVRPLLRRRGIDPVAVTAGYALFHSSYAGKVQKYADKYDLDVRDLIVRLCEKDLVFAPDELLERLGRELAAEKVPRVLSVPIAALNMPKAQTSSQSLPYLLKQIRTASLKLNKYSALNVVIGEEVDDEISVSGNIQRTHTHVVGSVSFTNQQQLENVLLAADGAVDVVYLDVDRKPFAPATSAQVARRLLRKSLLLTYLDSQVWISAIEDQIVRALGEILEGVPLVIAGDHAKSRFLALRLAERRADVTILAAEPELTFPDPSSLASISLAPTQVSIERVEYNSQRARRLLSEARLVVVWPQSDPWFDRELAKHLGSGTYMLDAGIGSILDEAQETARAQQVQLLRVNVWPTLAGALSAAHESARVFGAAFGGERIAGVPVIAGGALGQYGDVVVDSVHQPTRVIGVADGRGGVIFNYGEAERQSVLKVSEEIHRKLLTPRLEADA